jgi:hypothetical protein
MKSIRRFGMAIALLIITTTVLATKSYTNVDLYVSNERYYFTLVGVGCTLTANLTTTPNENPQCSVTDAIGVSYYLYYGDGEGGYYAVFPDGSW